MNAVYTDLIFFFTDLSQLMFYLDFRYFRLSSLLTISVEVCFNMTT